MLIRKSPVVIVAAILLFLAVDSGQMGALPKEDPFEPFQGDWVVTKIAFGDYEFKGSATKPIIATFQKNKMLLKPSFSHKYQWALQFGTEVRESGTVISLSLDSRGSESILTLPPMGKPGEMDFEEFPKPPLPDRQSIRKGNAPKKANEKPESISRKGIFRFKDGALELCLDAKADKRPTQFLGSNESIYLHLVREKK